MIKKLLQVVSMLMWLSSKVVAQAPANDDPCNAIPLTVGTTCNFSPYTNANATATTGVPAPGCASYGGGDVWFSVTVPSSGSLTFNSNTGVITDGGMAIYYATSCNGTFTLIECDDDDSPNGLMPFITSVGLTPGSTVYIRFWEYGNNGNGTFRLCVFDNSPPPPVPSTTCLTPTPDICINACDMGTLPAPPPCSGTANQVGAAVAFSLSNIGATSANPYSTIAPCAIPAADVWYRFRATGTQLLLSLTSTTDVLNQPNVSLYNGSNCNALLPVQCFVGTVAGLAVTYAPLTPNDYYYIQISGADPADVGNFNLQLSNNTLCATCLLGSDLTVTPAPVNGTYNAGQTVDFCFTVTNYNQTAVNWLHGVDLNFGPGWDVATLTPTSIPGSCNVTAGANWGFYNSVTGTALGVTYGPGFFYETSSGGPGLDGNPGNNFGDAGVGTTCPRTFCWRITTNQTGSCIDGASLNVAINTTGDYESGSWTSSGCTQDPIVNFNAALSCCPQALISTVPCTCGSTNGSATATGQGLNPPFDYTWSDALGTTLQTVVNVAGSNTLSGLLPGQYFVTVVDANNCTSIQTATVASTGSITATANNTGPYCPGGTISLSSTAGATSYAWSGPSGFTATTQNATQSSATVAMSGTYTVTITDAGGCTATATTNVMVNPNPTASITPVSGAICSGQITTLTASGGGTYLWSNAASSAAVSVSPVGTTTYTVTVTNNGCSDTATATVNVNANPIASISPATSTICNGQSTSLTASGGVSYMWSNFTNTASITVSPSITTSFTVTVTDANACTATATGSVVVNSNPMAVVNPASDTVCIGVSTTLTASGGNSYLWSNGANTSSITVTPIANITFTVTVTDANTCTSTTSASVNVNGLPIPTISPANVTICNGQSTTLTANGGISYLWSNTATTSGITVSPLITTTYTITVTDANNCSSSTSRTVNVNPNPIPAINPASVTICNGNSTTLTATGGTNYLWSNAANTVSITVTPSITTTYTVSVIDVNTCSASTSATVIVNSNPIAAVNPATIAICNGNNTTLTASGGVSYLWSNSANSANISVSPTVTTTYTVTVTDANACTASTTATVTVNSLPVASVSPATVAICSGNNTTVTASGGTSYLWSNTANTANIIVSPVATTTYTVTVTDVNSCSATSSVTVTVNNNPVGAINPSAISICSGNNTTLTASGGTSYLWSNAANTVSISVNPLASTTYNVTVTDVNSCTGTASAVVTVVPAILLSYTQTNVICNGQSNGSINLTVSGGQAPFSFVWSNGAATEDVLNLTVGTYSVGVGDAVGCLAFETVNITQPTALLATETHTNVSCNGTATGSIDVSVNGGTSPYNYTWNDSNTNEDRSSLSAGLYLVTITDALNCSTTLSVSITQPTVLNVTESHVMVSCNGGNTGSINVSVTGATSPYTFVWNDAVNLEDRSGLAAGSYSVTVTDDNFCSVSVNVGITQPSAFLLSETHTVVSCSGGNNGSIDITVAGATPAYTYLWNDAATAEDRNMLPSGAYTITVTDNNSCTSSLTVNVGSVSGLSISDTHTAVSCNGVSDASINITVSGSAPPYNYLWSDADTSEDRNNLPAGTYGVTATDANTCQISLSVIVNEPTALVLTETHSNVLCNGGSSGGIDLNVTGATAPYSYIWNDAVITEDRTQLSANNYTVTVADFNMCSATMSIVVLEPTVIVVAETHSNASCNQFSDGSINVTLSGGVSPFSYMWSDGPTTEDRFGVAASTYVLTATDFNQCTSTVSVTISEPSAVNVVETHADVFCNSGNDATIDITPGGGSSPYTFSWSDAVNTEDRTGISAGVYSVVVNDVNLCSASLSIIISEPTQIVVVEAITNASCATYSDGSIVVNVAGGIPPYNYTWLGSTNQSAVMSGVGEGSYSVTVTDNNGCSLSETYVVVEPNGMTFSDSYVNPTCVTNPNDGSISIQVSGGLQPYTFQWSNAAAQTNPSALGPGVYSVTMTDANNCSLSSTYVLSYQYVFTVEATPDVTINFGESTTLGFTVTGAPGSFENVWSPSGSLSCSDCVSPVSSPQVSTTYQVEVTNNAGCVATDLVKVTVVPNYDVFVPNAFTPNGDGNNDVFTIFGNIKALALLNIQIFNRWGEKVYESSDHRFEWDGSYKGELQNPQVFTWQLRLTFLDGHMDELRVGTITLVR